MNDGATSVWPTGQRSTRAQLREAGCVPGTEFDQERIPPAVAAHAIAAWTRTGDLVLDPDCGAGTVLTESLRAGRHALGLTVRKPWWNLARANVTAAKTAGAWCDGSVLEARPRMLATVRAAGLVGRVGLVLTALRTGPERDRVESAVGALAQTLQYCEPLLRPGGHVAIVARPHRRADGSLVDLASLVITAATTAGLALVERCVALSAEVRGSRLVVRGSGEQRRVAHHEVLVFQLVHDAELAAATAAGIPWPTQADVIRPAVNGVAYPGWRRAA
ncbi:DNA methyltransferase [Lentzea rhizosphaerae]|uniref:DNA methyltransferase n=1 Tax=Lentzea rhizosphaerae TaxID=2041025 RepID=A0ABV8C807_9PSEU